MKQLNETQHDELAAYAAELEAWVKKLEAALRPFADVRVNDLRVRDGETFYEFAEEYVLIANRTLYEEQWP